MKYAVSVITPEVPGEAPLALFEGDFSARLGKAKECGFQGIELVTCDPAALDGSLILRSLQEHDLQAAAIATGFIASSRGLTLISADPEVRAAAAKLLRELVLFAGAVNAPVVTIGSFHGKLAGAHGNVSKEEAAEQLREAMSSVDPLAESLGVCLALEPIRPADIDFLTNAKETCAFLEEGGFRSAGLLLDSFHVFGNEPDPLAAFDISKEKLVHVHLADTSRLPVGKGEIDFAGMEAVLRGYGYAGWQSLELARAEDPDSNARVSLEYLRTQ